MGLHMAHSVQPGYARWKKLNRSWNWDSAYKLLRRLNNMFKADLVFLSLAKWRWKTDTTACKNIVGDKRHIENKITPKYFSWRSADRDSWRSLSRVFFRLEPLIWGLGSSESLHSQKLGIMSIYHCPSISPWWMGRGNCRNAIWMQPEKGSAGLQEQWRRCTRLYLQFITFRNFPASLDIVSVPFMQLKLQKPPKEKENAYF